MIRKPHPEPRVGLALESRIVVVLELGSDRQLKAFVIEGHVVLNEETIQARASGLRLIRQDEATFDVVARVAIAGAPDGLVAPKTAGGPGSCSRGGTVCASP